MAYIKAWLDKIVRGKAKGSGITTTQSAPLVRENITGFAAGNNEFSVAMFKQLRRTPGNLFFSPFSIRSALGMTYAGAMGSTAMQIREALGYQLAAEADHLLFGDIYNQLNSANGDGCELEVANSLWGQKGMMLQPEFVDRIARHYGGTMMFADFRNATDAACAAINRWVEDKTRRKILNIIGELDPLTSLVLVNALYFKGKWGLQFRKAATHDEPFYLDDGLEVKTPLMYQQTTTGYMQGEGYQAVDLAYETSTLSMLVILPDRKDGLRDLEESFSGRTLNYCVKRIKPHEVKLFIPRFKITWKGDLRGELNALGINDAFDREKADLSGINGRKPPDDRALFISCVIHKAFSEVNEDGTEAAAATVVMMPLTARPSFSLPKTLPIFRADHPFLFVIRERNSGTILFFGRLSDPTLKN